MFFLLASVLAAAVGYEAWRQGPRAALGYGFYLALLLPAWVQFPVAGLPIDLRLLTVAIALLVYCGHRDSSFRARLVPADYAILMLFGVHLFSDFTNEGFTFVLLFRAYGEWMIPYLGGRLAVTCSRDIRRLLPLVCVVSVVLAVWSITEAVTHQNPADYVFGSRPETLAAKNVYRLGLKRAEGPTSHSIWFGMIQLLLLPWTVTAAAEMSRGHKSNRTNDALLPLGEGGRRPDEGVSLAKIPHPVRFANHPLPYGERLLSAVSASTAWALPILGAVGVFGSGSRGPIAGVAILAFMLAYWHWAAWRLRLLIGAGTLVIAVVANWAFVYEGLHVWSGEAPAARKTILLEGERAELSAVSQRWLLLKAYGPSVWRAGLLGFGTDRTSTFPIRVPFGPDVRVTQTMLWSIDNEYLLMQLRFGWLGVAAFTAAGFLAAWGSWRLAERHALANAGDLEQNVGFATFNAALAGTLGAMMLLFCVEWMAYDFGFAFIWTLGMASGMRSAALDGPECKTKRAK
jgi:hypothetical protein